MKMSKQYIYFGELPINSTFSLNGNEWRKRSTRTAEIISDEYKAHWFYFGKKELCVVGQHSRI